MTIHISFASAIYVVLLAAFGVGVFMFLDRPRGYTDLLSKPLGIVVMLAALAGVVLFYLGGHPL